MSRLNETQVALRPLDLLVLFHLATADAPSPTYAEMASALGIVPSQAHTSLARLRTARLVHPEGSQNRSLIRAAAREFVLFGAKYTFPAILGSATRGMPTSYAAPPLRDAIVQGSELAPVWPQKDGEMRGLALQPLHPAVPGAASANSALYELLALFDALRSGAARERELAMEMLRQRI